MVHLEPRPFGRTGLDRSRRSGSVPARSAIPALDDREVETLLRTAVERGVTLIDTARSYGLCPSSGSAGSLRRCAIAVVLSTKVGYGVDGVADWTGECIRRGIDQRARPHGDRSDRDRAPALVPDRGARARRREGM
jgi:aryl-alcohol dehydrogenase-like predicted oxidoreductase